MPGQDFRRDIWPQIARELVLAHLLTLVKHHPGTVAVGRDKVTARVAAAAVEDLDGLVADVVVEPTRRIWLERLDRPGVVAPDEHEWAVWVQRWRTLELESITRPDASPRAMVNRAMAVLRLEVARLAGAGAIDGASIVRDLTGWFEPLGLVLASGPPPERTAELLALVGAGVVELLGEGMQVGVADGRFVGRSAVRAPARRTRAFVETRMSQGHADVTDDPLLRGLLDTGRARLHARPSASGPALTRSLDVAADSFTLVDAAGHEDPRVIVLGSRPATSSPARRSGPHRAYRPRCSPAQTGPRRRCSNGSRSTSAPNCGPLAPDAVREGSAMTETVDIVVIGMGPGGEDAAARLAEAGLSVVGVESRLVGGECPYYACVPTKMMVRAADVLTEGRRVGELAGRSEVHPHWHPVAARIRDEATDDWDDTAAVERFEQTGGRFVRGRAEISAPGEVTVSTTDGELVLRAERGIVLNPGTEPAVPPIDGLADTPYWTNRDAVVLQEIPASLIVLGGGPVGCELAQIFARFGSEVTLLEAGNRLLGEDEPEAGQLLADVFAAEGIDVRTGASVRAVEHTGAEFVAHIDAGAGDAFRAQHLLVATGRRTDLVALGVGAVGLDDEAGVIEVDERMRATSGVWAIGDVTGHGQFTHVSMYQAGIAVADILGRDGATADYRAVPRVTFTDPEIGAVGLTEASARDAGLRVRTGQADVAASTRGWIHKEGNEGLIKLVEDADRGVLVGATSTGPTGGEVLGALAVAVHAEVPTERLREQMFAYPTFHRAIANALRDLAG
ncbi:hypothetical protein GCM10023169_38970 [Georgenia halophila]|uniref:Pyruvate/2-oxoglutarate dehydrogenase complex, dihydrolipoamide dehydrogenase (E3) component n=1 Tax=Georgenia halophila TaxID=620889 RepID=A0ABP8LNF6_9MICO